MKNYDTKLKKKKSSQQERNTIKFNVTIYLNLIEKHVGLLLNKK